MGYKNVREGMGVDIIKVLYIGTYTRKDTYETFSQNMGKLTKKVCKSLSLWGITSSKEADNTEGILKVVWDTFTLETS